MSKRSNTYMSAYLLLPTFACYRNLRIALNMSTYFQLPSTIFLTRVRNFEVMCMFLESPAVSRFTLRSTAGFSVLELLYY